jgi:ABC-type branched-subunit amino acid transport system ATPase component
MPPDSTGTPALRVSDVSVAIGDRKILHEISFETVPGELVGLVGSNGSGKSSLLNVLSGYYQASHGVISFGGTDITGLRPSQISRLGLGRSFQSVGSFRELTVFEYVLVGREPSWHSGLLADVVGSRRARKAGREHGDLARDAIDQVGLAPSADRRLMDCPYGVRKIADVIRAAIAGATVLLMDEPTSGVGGAGADSMRNLCRWFMGEAGGEGIVMVDHDVGFVRSLCPRIIALSSGRVIADGPADDVLAHDEVIRTFLGA